MSYHYPNTSYSFPKLRTVSLPGYWRCYWCDTMQGRWYARSVIRLTEFSKKPVCESCYIAYRKRVARQRKIERDRSIRREDAYAQRDYHYHLRMRLKAMKPDPWRDFSRLKLVRILENAIQAIKDEWEREALAGYYALGMGVSK